MGNVPSGVGSATARLLLLAVTAALLVVPLTSAPADHAAAQVATPPSGAPYVPDVIAQFNALSQRAEALGWHLGVATDPTVCKHWQGMARSTGPGTPYLFVSRSGNNTFCPDQLSDLGGYLTVVQMASRPTTGERLRSNKLAKGTPVHETAPPAGDRVVGEIRFDGSGGWPHYMHPGGLQILDDVLIVPLETPASSDDPDNLILFVDVSDPENPSLLSTFDPHTKVGSSLTRNWSAGLVAVTAMPDGRYLMLVTGKSNERLLIFRSAPTAPDGTTDLQDPELDWEYFDAWFEAADENDVGADWPTGGTHQMLNFIREGGPNGALFLFGARNTTSGAPFGEDHIDLYRVTLDEQFHLRRVATKHLVALATPTHSTLGAHDIANLAAASAVHVSPTAELLFYATEHDNDGPAGSIKAGEWRHHHMVRPGSPTLDPTAEPGGPYAATEGGSVQLDGAGAPPRTMAWAELFVDPSFGERSVVVDYPDRNLDDFLDLRGIEAEPGDFDGFSDDASSLRWFAPVGCTVRLNDDDPGDGDFPGEHTRTLPGNGNVQQVADLDDLLNDAGTGDMDGEITGLEFSPLLGGPPVSSCADYYAAPLRLRWDLDGDGTFEASGAPASFSAAALDGPATVEIALEARHPTDGRRGIARTTVRIDNAAPTITSVTVYDALHRELGVDVPGSLVGLPATVVAPFTDPGVGDTHTATLDWGDGTVADLGSVADAVEATHAYAQPGRYEVTVTVEDDDGGSVTSTTTIDVLDAAAAIDLVVDRIDELLDGTLPPDAGAALRRARNALVGSAGHARNGAQAQLEAGRLETALSALRSAVVHLERADRSGAGDLEDLRLLLGLTARSVAEAAYAEALATSSPSDEHVMRMGERLQTGNDRLAAGDVVGSIDAYLTVVAPAP